MENRLLFEFSSGTRRHRGVERDDEGRMGRPYLFRTFAFSVGKLCGGEIFVGSKVSQY